MSQKELRQLVVRLEADAASRPWRYKARVVALALLGYAYLLLILVLSVGLPVVFVLGLFTSATAVFIQLVLKLGIPLFALAAVLASGTVGHAPRRGAERLEFFLPRSRRISARVQGGCRS